MSDAVTEEVEAEEVVHDDSAVDLVKIEEPTDMAHLAQMVSEGLQLVNSSSEAQVKLAEKALDIKSATINKMIPAAYILLFFLLFIIVYLLVVKDDIQNAMVVVGFIGTGLLSWIAGSGHSKKTG